jgi:hypothetical protein
MTRSTELRDQTLSHAEPRTGTALGGKVGSKIKLVVSRSILWSYERGTWQYDLIVIAILAFIFFTPRSWFEDRPTLQLTDLRHNQGIVEMGRTPEGWRYLVDSRLVDSLSPGKPEQAIQEILQRRLRKPFTIKSIVAVKDRNQVILGYTVVVER